MVALGGLLAAALAAAGCARDFDGLFVEDGKPSGSSGTSGKPGSTCACSTCTSPASCALACSSTCDIDGCACAPVVCETGDCNVTCAKGTSCSVDCRTKGTCTVTCDPSASCLCTGGGCVFASCAAGKPQACNDGSITCQRGCP